MERLAKMVLFGVGWVSGGGIFALAAVLLIEAFGAMPANGAFVTGCLWGTGGVPAGAFMASCLNQQENGND